jgi:hypothetical protein
LIEPEQKIRQAQLAGYFDAVAISVEKSARRYAQIFQGKRI